MPPSHTPARPRYPDHLILDAHNGWRAPAFVSGKGLAGHYDAAAGRVPHLILDVTDVTGYRGRNGPIVTGIYGYQKHIIFNEIKHLRELQRQNDTLIQYKYYINI